MDQNEDEMLDNVFFNESKTLNMSGKGHRQLTKRRKYALRKGKSDINLGTKINNRSYSQAARSFDIQINCHTGAKLSRHIATQRSKVKL